MEDDNAVWIGSRNGVTFGRFDENNPKLLGPTLEIARFLIYGRPLSDAELEETIGVLRDAYGL